MNDAFNGKQVDAEKVRRAKKILKYYEAQDGECAYCGTKLTLALGYNNTAEVDHVVPKANQRVKGKWNEVAAGAACNAFKGDLPLHEVLVDMRRLKLCASPKRTAVQEALLARGRIKNLRY